MPNIPVDNGRFIAVIALVIAVVVVLLLIPWKGHPPLRHVTPPPFSRAEAPQMVEVVPSVSLLETPSASAHTPHPAMTAKKQRLVAVESKSSASTASPTTRLQEALKNAGEDLSPDGSVPTDILNAIEVLGRGRWPENEEATRWAMIATIKRFLPQFANAAWPDGRTSIAQLKPVFYKALEVKKLTDLVALLKAAPAPAPSTSP